MKKAAAEDKKWGGVLLVVGALVLSVSLHQIVGPWGSGIGLGGMLILAGLTATLASYIRDLLDKAESPSQSAP
jgi:hypothetical protein